MLRTAHGATLFSMRRSGISHMIATVTYSASAAHGYANANGIATAYISTDSLSLDWWPSACQRGGFAVQRNQGAHEDVVGDARKQQHDSVHGGRPRGEMIFAHPRGGEGHQREPEQEVQVRPKHGSIHAFDRLKEIVVVAPVNAEIHEAQHVTGKYRKLSQQTCRAGACRRSQFQHHDGDGDGDDAIAEAYDSSCSHGPLRCLFARLGIGQRPSNTSGLYQARSLREAFANRALFNTQVPFGGLLQIL